MKSTDPKPKKIMMWNDFPLFFKYKCECCGKILRRTWCIKGVAKYKIPRIKITIHLCKDCNNKSFQDIIDLFNNKNVVIGIRRWVKV